MVEVYSSGLMEDVMMEITFKIRNMVMVSSNGLMVENMKVTGTVESSMVKEDKLQLNGRQSNKKKWNITREKESHK